MKRALTYLGVAVLLCMAAAWGADRLLRTKGHPGLRTFVGQVLRNYPRSFNMEPPVLEIRIDGSDMKRLEAVVEQARERGVILPEGNEAVDAIVDAGEGGFRARIRIKGKLSDHVEGSKWSFRVVAKKDGGFLGMRRFSLQHPGTRNYLYEWLYHRLCAGEGLVALRYGFCRVMLNGDDLGIYAYEEHFGPELLAHNERVNGPILRFDPGLYWVHRLNRMQGRDLDEAYAAFQSATLDAYGTSDLLKDKGAFREFQEALALVDGFRRGTLTAPQVFDVDRMARRHALIDLVGGHHAMDWSDVKFHYDPVARRLAPVSYESFSAFPTRELAGAYRMTGAPSEADELHDLLFKDSAFFAAYVHHLERFARKEWLDSTFATLQALLDSAAATLYREFPYKELDRGIYYRNQEAIRRMLHPPKGAHAYLMALAPDSAVLHLVPINSLPMQVEALRLQDGHDLRPAAPMMLVACARNSMGTPQAIAFSGKDLSSGMLKDAMLVTRVPGSSAEILSAIFPFPDGSDVDMAQWPTQLPPNVNDFAFIDVDEAAHRMYIRPGAHRVDHDLVIPAGFTVHAEAPLRLELGDGVRIISRSALHWVGAEDGPIEVQGGDPRGQILLHAGDARSELRHVRMSVLRSHQCDLRITWSELVGLRASEGSVQVSNSRFIGGGDQLRAEFVDLWMRTVLLDGAGDDALSLRGGKAVLEDVSVAACKGIALKAEQGAVVKAVRMHVSEAAKAIEALDGSHVAVKAGAVHGVQLVVHAGKARMRDGAVRVELEGVALPDGAAMDRGEGSVILLDGRPVGATALAP